MLALEQDGDVRTLVCLVEEWSARGEPTPAARLAEARALLRLRLMDRAWIRLQEVHGAEPGPEVACLLAEMFLLRGWPARARTVVQDALADHPDDLRLQELWDAATGEDAPTEIDDPLAEAERQLAAGAFLAAQRILERLRRQLPADPRVAELLWALEGDFRLQGTSAAAVVERVLPALEALPDLPEETEHTESIPVVPAADRDADPRSFPPLFRGQETDLGPDDDTGEVTQTVSMASIDELQRAFTTPDPSAVDEDTQIVRVVHNQRGSEPPPPTPSSFDLRFSDARPRTAPPASDLDLSLEEEDADLIILTRHGPEAASPQEGDLIDPDPTTSDLEDDDSDDVPRHTMLPVEVPRRRTRRRRSSPPAAWLVPVAVIVVLATLVFAVVVARVLL